LKETEEHEMSSGKIVQIIGAVIDVEFPRDQSRKVYDALTVDGTDTTLEVQQQLGDGVVRTIAMGSTEGLRRGLDVTDTGQPVLVPVGKETLGRIMDVLGQPDRRSRPEIGEKARMPIHRTAPDLRRAGGDQRAAGNRHQGDRPDLPVRQGRQGRSVRRRRRRQDRQHDGADPQHRHRAQRLLGVRRCRRAYPRG
jgi:hypothetical protein